MRYSRSFLTSAWFSRKESLLYKGDRYAMVQHLYKTNTLLGTSVWQILDGSEELSMSPLKHFQFWFQSLAPYYGIPKQTKLSTIFMVKTRSKLKFFVLRSCKVSWSQNFLVSLHSIPMTTFHTKISCSKPVPFKW